MKRVLSDGSQELRFTPLAFVRRIAMLVPAPRQHEITYFGLLTLTPSIAAISCGRPSYARSAHDAGAATAFAIGEEISAQLRHKR